MVPFVDLLAILVSAFGLGLIPFAGPSNLLVASTWAISLGYSDPVSLTLIGLMVALGAAAAKGIHYMITFFVGGHLGEKRRQRLDSDATKIHRWAFLLLFAAAATPIPDEPVVIPLGLMKYSPVKFFVAFFLGKLSITVFGAFLGSVTGHALEEYLSPEIMVAISIALTIIITIILLKVDLGKLAEKCLQRRKKVAPAPEEEKPQGKP
jgi:uncharacterized membrane protein YdjX (TVP38/TMEM64 family)